MCTAIPLAITVVSLPSGGRRDGRSMTQVSRAANGNPYPMAYACRRRASTPMEQRNPEVHMGSPRFTTAEFGGFLVTDTSFPTGLTLPVHAHDRTVLAVTLRGRWESVIGGRVVESVPGSVLTEPAGDPHSNRFADAGARILIVQPDVRRARELFPHDVLLGEVHHFACGPTTALARRLQIEVNHRDAASPVA